MKFGGIVAFALLILSGTAFAAPVWTNGNQLVSHIIWIPGASGFCSVGTFDNPQTCPGADSGSRYQLHPTIQQDPVTTNRLLALLTTAMVAGKKIFVYVDGCVPGTGIPYFTGVQVHN